VVAFLVARFSSALVVVLGVACLVFLLIHLVLGPATVLLAIVMSVNLLGDRLRDGMDVRGRVRGADFV